MIHALQFIAQTGYSYDTGSEKLLPWLSLPVVLAVIGLVILSIVGMWKMFVKAGRPGWASIVPIYNGWVLYEISGKPGWWVLVGAVPFVGPFIAIILSLLASIELAKRFGKTTSFGVVMLFLVPFIGYLILGFGDDRYDANGQNDGQGGKIADVPYPTVPKPAQQQPAAPAPQAEQSAPPQSPQQPPTPPANLVQ